MTMDGGGGQGDGPPCWHPRRPRRSIGGGGGAQGGASGVAPAGAVASSTRFFPWRLAVVAVCAAQWPRRSIRVAAWLLAAATLDGARTARRRPSGARPAGRWQERERHGWRPRGVCRAALGLGTGAARVRWPHPPPPLRLCPRLARTRRTLPSPRVMAADTSRLCAPLRRRLAMVAPYGARRPPHPRATVVVRAIVPWAGTPTRHAPGAGAVESRAGVGLQLPAREDERPPPMA